MDFDRCEFLSVHAAAGDFAGLTGRIRAGLFVRRGSKVRLAVSVVQNARGSYKARCALGAITVRPNHGTATRFASAAGAGSPGYVWTRTGARDTVRSGRCRADFWATRILPRRTPLNVGVWGKSNLRPIQLEVPRLPACIFGAAAGETRSPSRPPRWPSGSCPLCVLTWRDHHDRRLAELRASQFRRDRRAAEILGCWFKRVG